MLSKKDGKDELIQGVVSLVRKLKQHYSDPSKEPFSFVQMQVIWYLAGFLEDKKENPTMSEVAEFMKVKRATCSQLIERLVEMKLVRRETDEKDRRIIRLVLTSKGLKEMDKMKEQRLYKLKGLLDKLNEDDIKALKRIISKLS